MRLLLATLFCLHLSNARYLNSQDFAEETQHAVCKIVTEKLHATANVTFTRELRGVCTSTEMSQRLEELQRNLLKELQLIREELVGKQTETAKPRLAQDFSTQKTFSLQKRTVETELNGDNRIAEILRYNGTVYSTAKGSFFSYYWKVENVKELLLDANLTSVKSPGFVLMGQRLNIMLFPHHLTSKYLGIQLKGPRVYFLKHRFTIVDQFSSRGDLSSQILGDERNFAVTYRVAHDRIQNNNYIDNNIMVIKLTVFMA